MPGCGFTDASVLTPLAEYRNGGLIVDLGLIEPRHARVLGEACTAPATRSWWSGAP
jgi:3',5'-cyclic AMP phosphodiesterase CpdA